jgi:hypothetical protein
VNRGAKVTFGEPKRTKADVRQSQVAMEIAKHTIAGRLRDGGEQSRPELNDFTPSVESTQRF